MPLNTQKKRFLQIHKQNIFHPKADLLNLLQVQPYQPSTVTDKTNYETLAVIVNFPPGHNLHHVHHIQPRPPHVGIMTRLN